MYFVKKTGVITTLSRKGSYLFIRPDGEEEDVFCHCSEVEETMPIELVSGLIVEFEPREDDRGQVRRVRVVA